ncbi:MULTISPECIES: hypothetical protein [Sorangium]|uniref:Uncharacterized protein n=1 Tax=Sorangium cellulosum TaxID=56 RepID=A0A4P2QI99_SORCE|nr:MULTISPECIES: hypothetical protein [Sorangium]AUX29640.1 uncharacterized protein SOCE836_017310 [Sorangium cellulosum]WCQ89029.1 hypothetical protein NQZ70_01714 [Sorangium sp. Soce836]
MQLEITDGGGSGGSGTGGTGGTRGTGGTGGTGGSGGSGSGGTGAGGGDPGGAGGGPACEAHEPRVFACTDIDLPERADPSGCNLGLAVEYIVSAAPAP